VIPHNSAATVEQVYSIKKNANGLKVLSLSTAVAPQSISPQQLRRPLALRSSTMGLPCKKKKYVWLHAADVYHVLAIRCPLSEACEACCLLALLQRCIMPRLTDSAPCAEQEGDRRADRSPD
jgi:hypothetical protein